MKIIVNNTCFVDLKDIKNKSIPKTFVIERLDYDYNEYVVLKDVRSIDFVKNQEDIIDYFDICDLSQREIDKTIEKVVKYIKIKKDMRYYNILLDLLKYKCNRDGIDIKVRDLINNDIFNERVTKKNLLFKRTF